MRRRYRRRRPSGQSALPILMLSLLAALLSVFLIGIALRNGAILSTGINWLLPAPSGTSPILSTLMQSDSLTVFRLIREPQEEPYFSQEEGFEELAPIEEVPPPAEEPSTPPVTQPIPENAHPIVDLTVTPNPQSGYLYTDNVYLNNSTTYELDLASLLAKPFPSINSDAPQVLIVHSHATESYTAEDIHYYTDDTEFRSTDTTQNMVAVGDVIAQELSAKGIGVIHDTTLNDYPKYSGSYTRMLTIIESYLAQYPSISCVLDVHRDSMITADGSKQYKVVTEVDGQKSAQIMIVAGSEQGGLSHPGWQDNLSFALKLQQSMETKYPTLTRPIHLRKERFNQHTTIRSLILEMGTSGNTLSEAKYAAKLISESLYDVLAPEK